MYGTYGVGSGDEDGPVDTSGGLCRRAHGKRAENEGQERHVSAQQQDKVTEFELPAALCTYHDNHTPERLTLVN